MRIDAYIPDLPAPLPGSRGNYAYVTPGLIQRAFAAQGGILSVQCLSARYILPDPDWMHTVLLKFQGFQLAVTGKQPKYLYQQGVYVCTEFAWNFKAFLNLCHILHWHDSIGDAKIAVGFAWTGNRPAGNIPANHAITVILNKEHELCGYEPQLAMSLAARYGRVEDCRFFAGVLF